jgi:hypothetical protein
MADVARALPRERWAHVGELMGTDSIDATATERRAVFARLTARRARKVDWTCPGFVDTEVMGHCAGARKR